MPCLSRWLLALLAVIGASLAVLSSSSGQEATRPGDDLFTSGKVRQLSFEIPNKELDSLRRDPRKYVPVTLKADTTTFKSVGLKIKGAAGSFRGIDDKPGLTVNMDKFGVEKRFHGMNKWHLANSVQDPSYVSELVCGELFREAGVPAARIAHAVVTINGRGRGLYYLKEGYDKGFRKRHFGIATGNFYDGGFLRDIDQPLHLLAGAMDVKEHKDLKALVAASREPKLDVRFKKLEELLDLDRFISFLCLEVITWDWDGYPMKCNNYRIHHDPKRNKITFLPSGMDQMFGEPNGPLFPHFEGMVARGLIETPEGKARYLRRMDEQLNKVFLVEKLKKRLKELEKQIQPALTSVDAGAGRDYPNQVRRLTDAIEQRSRHLKSELVKATRRP